MDSEMNLEDQKRSSFYIEGLKGIEEVLTYISTLIPYQVDIQKHEDGSYSVDVSE